MFSEEFKQRFNLEFRLKLEGFSSVTALRFYLEQAYDEAVGYVTSDSEPASAEFLKYNRIKKLYDLFMRDFTAWTDAKTILQS